MNYIHSENHIKEIVKSYMSGCTTYSIAETYNVWPEVIRKLLTKAGVQLRSKGQKPGATPHNKGKKFTEKSIEHTKKLIRTGEIHNLKEGVIRKHYKRLLIYENGNTCSICNMSIWQNKPIPLVCDHIDGNTNNSNRNNFRLVCSNCDAQLPTYKSKNRGNGRKYDREYYQNNLRKSG